MMVASTRSTVIKTLSLNIDFSGNPIDNKSIDRCDEECEEKENQRRYNISGLG